MNCACGRPLHYSDPNLQQMVERLVADLGETVNVTVVGRTWRVPRHYIALHGIKGANIANLGFEEIVR